MQQRTAEEWQRLADEERYYWELAWQSMEDASTHQPYLEAYLDWQDDHPGNPMSYAEWDVQYTPGDRD